MCIILNNSPLCVKEQSLRPELSRALTSAKAGFEKREKWMENDAKQVMMKLLVFIISTSFYIW